VAEVPLPFAGVLRGLRTDAGLTQEELAEATGLSSRAISYLERGEVATPRKETVRLLADALRLTGPARAQFETAARGRSRARVYGPRAATRTLPRDVASFTGRRRELAELMDTAASAGGVVSIQAIGGMAGIGKTAFAVHAAHRLADRFPGGQVFLPLHGHTPGQQAVEPADALASLLLTVGVPAAQVPAGLEGRMALWRDRVAQRQLLLILDDAISSEQAAPLLPGSGESLVLITSRRQLSALVDATAISLDTLLPGEAAVLLVRLTGRAGLNPEDPAVGELTRLCGYLPLAIGMVARQLRHHPAWSAAGRAAELASARDRLGLMTTENLSVAAAFDLSYADLTGDQQRLFRRLGLHPGPGIDAYAAAALDGTDLSAARRGLEDLYDQHLITEPAQGWYRLHDLIREHARALADRLDPDADRTQATARLLDYYQHTAARAAALISRHPRPSAEGTLPAAVPDLTDNQQALAWMRAERANLVACLDHVTSTGHDDRVIALTATLAELWRNDGPWAEAITRQTVAIQASRRVGDRLSHARALNDQGELWRLIDENTAAAQAHQEALGIYRELGDQLGQANALNLVGNCLWLTDDYPAAARAHEEALGIYRQVGNQLGQANALNRLGDVRQHLGDYPAAAQALEQALAIYGDIGDPLGQANGLNALGAVLKLTGDYPAAIHAHEEALGIYRQVGSRIGEGVALVALGDVLRRTGDYPAAVRALEQALSTYREVGSRLGEADALNALGAVLRLTGDYRTAAQALEQAVGIYRRVGNRTGVAEVLNEKGTLLRVSGELALAEESHQQALDEARAIGRSWQEAQSLAGLGRCALVTGRTAEGEATLRIALAIFERTGSAEAADVAAELDVLSRPGSGSQRAPTAQVGSVRHVIGRDRSKGA
jgi:tetratricopeptide (TPR) repeat protein/transcriptional regulator with XRE-family HTH domain